MEISKAVNNNPETSGTEVHVATEEQALDAAVNRPTSTISVPWVNS